MNCSASTCHEPISVNVDKDNIQDNEVNEDEPKDPKVGSKRVRNTSSSVWNYFDKVAMGSVGKRGLNASLVGNSM
ncbi:zinc finger BED domain-containing protein RICESLEEPER 2-like [Sesbania bispinosa]|nr:zinc finger BED domain-containing protein RICESLEEPER 2-like [Sesbania bispinosa]